MLNAVRRLGIPVLRPEDGLQRREGGWISGALQQYAGPNFAAVDGLTSLFPVVCELNKCDGAIDSQLAKNCDPWT